MNMARRRKVAAGNVVAVNNQPLAAGEKSFSPAIRVPHHANLKLLMLLGAAAIAACGPSRGADTDSHAPSVSEEHAGSDSQPNQHVIDPRQSYEKLSQQYGLLSNRPEAVAQWKALAEEGYAPAQLAVGVAYALGKGVSRDEDQAISWLREAAEAGNATAQFDLGLLHIARGEFADAYEWSFVAARRAAGQLREEAQRQTNLLALVLPAIDLAKAERSAGDWLEELPEDHAVNNLASDQQLAFERLAPPSGGRPWSDLGWRQTAKWIQASAQASLRPGETLRQE